MIAPETVAEIRRLLGEDRLSQREIARRTGVCRGSVGAIASGRRPDYESQPDPPDDGPEEPAGPPARCPGCGAKVYMPCVLCHVRSEMKKASARAGGKPAARRPGIGRPGPPPGASRPLRRGPRGKTDVESQCLVVSRLETELSH